MATVGVTPTTALAADPIIREAGQIFNPGYAGPLTIDLTNSPAGDYEVNVWSEVFAYDKYFSYYRDGSDPTWEVAIPPIYNGDRYWVSVEGYTDDGDYVGAESSFRVRAFAAAITAPASGTTRVVGSTPTMKVQWSNMTPTTRVITDFYSHRTGSINKTCTAYGPAPGSTTSCTSNNLGLGTYTLRAKMVHPKNGNIIVLDRVGLTVVRAFDITSASTNITTFYPLVRDGYRDGVKMSWRTTAAADTVIRVRNSSGTVIRRVELGRRSGGYNSWYWNGRKNNGDKVQAGTYRIAVSGIGATRNDSIARAVTANTRWKVEEWRSWKAGSTTQNINTTGSCGASPDYWNYTLYLDCWDFDNSTSDHAVAKYNLPIHANAYDITWRLSTRQGCCYGGEFQKTGYRVDADTYRVSILIGGDRSVYIYRARVDYKRRVRI